MILRQARFRPKQGDNDGTPNIPRRHETPSRRQRQRRPLKQQGQGVHHRLQEPLQHRSRHLPQADKRGLRPIHQRRLLSTCGGQLLYLKSNGNSRGAWRGIMHRVKRCR